MSDTPSYQVRLPLRGIVDVDGEAVATVVYWTSGRVAITGTADGAFMLYPDLPSAQEAVPGSIEFMDLPPEMSAEDVMDTPTPTAADGGEESGND